MMLVKYKIFFGVALTDGVCCERVTILDCESYD